MLAGVTYLVPNWVEMCLYTSVPFLFYFLYLFVMPESPRWLLAQGKFEDALNILEVMARVNGKKLPNSFRIKLHERVEADKIRVKETAKSLNSFDLCKYENRERKHFLSTIQIAFCHFFFLKNTEYAFENTFNHIELVCK